MRLLEVYPQYGQTAGYSAYRVLVACYSTHLFKKPPILAHRREPGLVRHAFTLSIAHSRSCLS
jgi:hypothetical protein